MTYDTAVWKPSNDLLDPTAEFDRRFEQSDDYLTMSYQEGPTVEAFIARNAPALGLVAYSPISEDYVSA